MHGLRKRIQELTGIYGSGFSADSAFGIILPIAFVILVGGFGALLVYILN